MMLKPSKKKRIRFIDHDGRVGLPWEIFQDVFRKNGFEFLESSDEELEFEFLISCRHSDGDIRDCEVRGIFPTRRVLIVIEPECVDPIPFLHPTQQMYGRIFAKSDSWADRLGAESFRFFNGELALLDDSKRPDLLATDSRQNRFVMIQAHKFSVIRGEQYSLRREVSQEAWKNQLALDLYGRSWLMSNTELLRGLLFSIMTGISYAVKAKNLSVIKLRGLKMVRFKSREHYKGQPIDQIEILKKYRFALVIENSVDYVSEKLFHAMAAGCRVLYVGESLSTYGSLPSSVVVVETKRQLIIENMSRMLEETISQNHEPLQIRQEARMIFMDGDAQTVQEMLAKKILKEFSKDINVI